MAKAKPGPNQDELLVVAERSGQMVAREFNIEPDEWQNSLEANLHLQNALSGLLKINLLRPFVDIDEIIETRYADRTDEGRDEIREHSAAKLEVVTKSTKTEFAHAIGHFARISAGEDPESVKAESRRKFSDFAKKYSGASNNKRAHQLRQSLVQKVREMLSNDRPEVEARVTEFNRENGLRPHALKLEKKGEKIIKLTPLETRERLLAVQGDPRAGFIPKTNHAKNVVISWLDYLDNPEFPRGIRNQLSEVFTHNQRMIESEEQYWQTGNTEMALRGLESITWEVGDHAIDAFTSLVKMIELKKDLDDTPGAQTRLADAFPEGHPGLAVLIRHRALKELISTGDVKGLLHPFTILRTSQDPPPSARPNSNEPGKRKTLLNQFTRPDIRPKFAKYIAQQTEALRVGQVRGELEEVIDDLTNEFNFFRDRLIDILRIDDTMISRELFDYDQVKHAAQTALNTMSELYAVA